jgi:alpha-amylase
MSFETFSGDMNPWYFAYQPVSYRLQGRMGTRDQLRSAIHSCRAAGVRVYADAVINHMSGGGNDANTKHRNPNAGCATWGLKNSSLVTPGGAAGPSPMFTQSYIYSTNEHTSYPASQEYPAAHLGPTGLLPPPPPPPHLCLRLPLRATTELLERSSPAQRRVALGRPSLSLSLSHPSCPKGLTDLNTEKENVRERIADYLTDLISIGFSGFRSPSPPRGPPPPPPPPGGGGGGHTAILARGRRQ